MCAENTEVKSKNESSDSMISNPISSQIQCTTMRLNYLANFSLFRKDIVPCILNSNINTLLFFLSTA